MPRHWVVVQFEKTNNQISSHWTRRTFRLRIARLWYSAQAQPICSKSLRIVTLETPVILVIALMETPSTRAAITWVRLSVLSRFIRLNAASEYKQIIAVLTGKSKK